MTLTKRNGEFSSSYDEYIFLTVYRYCAAISAAAKPGKGGPALMPRPMLASLEDLLERLTETPSANPVNILGGRKGGKPGLDKLGSWIEGRLTKFIAGEDHQESAPTKPIAAPPTKGGFQTQVGPFSHFSTISPGASGQISRATSMADFHAPNGQLAVQPDSRRTSPSVPQGGWGNDHGRESSSSSSMYGDQYSSHAGVSSAFSSRGATQDVPLENDDERDTQTGYGRSDSYGDDEDLLNPMEQQSARKRLNGSASPSYEPKNLNGADDDEDLGFGNASLSRARTPRPADGSNEKADGKPAAGEQNKAAATTEASPGKSQCFLIIGRTHWADPLQLKGEHRGWGDGGAKKMAKHLPDLSKQSLGRRAPWCSTRISSDGLPRG